MQVQVVLERDAKTKRSTATVPGMPSVVDSTTKKDALRLAREATQLLIGHHPGAAQ